MSKKGQIFVVKFMDQDIGSSFDTKEELEKYIFDIHQSSITEIDEDIEYIRSYTANEEYEIDIPDKVKLVKKN